MAFDASNLQTLLGKINDDESSSGGDYVNCTFIPDGTHKIRIITDPENELYCKVKTYGYFAKAIVDPVTLQPSQLPNGFDVNDNPLKNVVKKLDDLGKWQANSKDTFLVYMYLYDTTSKSDNWKPGTLYCVLANWKVEKAIFSFVKALSDGAQKELLDILDHEKPAVIQQLITESGKKGQCAISTTFPMEMADPIDMEKHVWKPLSEAYVPNKFNQEKYNNLVSKYETDLKQAQLAEAAKPVEDQPTKDESPIGTVLETPATNATAETSTPPVEQGETSSVWDKFKPAQ